MSDEKGSDHDQSIPSDATKKMFEGLTEREVKVLKQRFGISLDGNFNLENLGKQCEVSIEHIQEIERKALRKLRR
ncbi:MAG: hypothetical protein COA86_11615 [Kangiella sp.]|nr:MAG: hypothetical protein COA86_11615 [Kangiella sp.]